MDKYFPESCGRCFEIFLKKKRSFLLKKTEYDKLLPEEECGICLDILKGSPCIKTEFCNHVFHTYCYQNYLKGTRIKKELTCPYCNSKQDNLNNFFFKYNNN